MVTVIPRSEWGARYSNGAPKVVLRLPFSEWWLHHSVTIAPDLLPPFDDEYRAMRVLEDIGQQRFGQGISYTWPIMPTGRAYEGHSVDRRGAHTGGRNDIARAICFVGNYETSRPTAAQIEAAAQLMVQEHRAGRAKTYRLNGGHRDLKSTSCPGRYAYEAIPAINARAAALMAGTPPMEDAMFSDQDRKDLQAVKGAIEWWLIPDDDPTTPENEGTPNSKGELGKRIRGAHVLTAAIAGRDAAAVAAAIPTDLARQVADELAKRLASGS